MSNLRSSRYLLGSLLAATIVIWHAFATKEQFYPATVYLSSSKLSVTVLGNLGFAMALTMYRLITRIFLGHLRDFEVERINDKVSQAIIETLLAMTIFRQDFTVLFLAQFAVLTFVKIFHWLAQGRVDFIETSPDTTRSQHARLVSFLMLLLAVDHALLRHALAKTMAHGVSVHLLFAFEYAVVGSTAAAILVKYALSAIDMAAQGRWEGKGLAIFYLELTLDLLHLITYSAFFAAVFSTYGIPIHLVRDLYWTFRNFQTRVRDFLRYRRVAAIMERRFPDATAEDLDRADHTCIVCREDMPPGSRPKRLDCGHVFHFRCLRSWLERQQNCPICRAPVAADRPAPSRGARQERQQQPQRQPQRPPAAEAGDAPRAGPDGDIAAGPDAAGHEVHRRPQAPAMQQRRNAEGQRAQPAQQREGHQQQPQQNQQQRPPWQFMPGQGFVPAAQAGHAAGPAPGMPAHRHGPGVQLPPGLQAAMMGGGGMPMQQPVVLQPMYQFQHFQQPGLQMPFAQPQPGMPPMQPHEPQAGAAGALPAAAGEQQQQQQQQHNIPATAWTLMMAVPVALPAIPQQQQQLQQQHAPDRPGGTNTSARPSDNTATTSTATPPSAQPAPFGVSLEHHAVASAVASAAAQAAVARARLEGRGEAATRWYDASPVAAWPIDFSRRLDPSPECNALVALLLQEPSERARLLRAIAEARYDDVASYGRQLVERAERAAEALQRRRQGSQEGGAGDGNDAAAAAAAARGTLNDDVSTERRRDSEGARDVVRQGRMTERGSTMEAEEPPSASTGMPSSELQSMSPGSIVGESSRGRDRPNAAAQPSQAEQQQGRGGEEIVGADARAMHGEEHAAEDGEEDELAEVRRQRLQRFGASL